MTYVIIDQYLLGEPIEAERLEPILALEIVSYRRESSGAFAVAEEHCEDLRTMLRLAYELEINPAGIETIMYMRKRLSEMQTELNYLRRLKDAWRAEHIDI